MLAACSDVGYITPLSVGALSHTLRATRKLRLTNLLQPVLQPG